MKSSFIVAIAIAIQLLLVTLLLPLPADHQIGWFFDARFGAASKHERYME